jgi:cell division protein FtsI (penicillin-binding protein 3)
MTGPRDEAGNPPGNETMSGAAAERLDAPFDETGDTTFPETGDDGAAPPLMARMLAARAPARPAPPPPAHDRAAWRLALVALVFVVAFGAVGARMGALALAGPGEPTVASTGAVVTATRAPIVDRAGRLLALDLPAWSIYAHPREMDDPGAAAAALARALPGLEAEPLASRFERSPNFAWVRRPATPAERQAVHDLGLPGVYFGTREARVYPNGRLAAHVLGGVRKGEEDVHAAETIGAAGVERAFDATLRDPGRAGAALRLSLDLSAQAVLTEAVAEAMKRLGAIGAAAVLMEADTGAIRALVSLPDYDPNAPPAPSDPGFARDKPTFNRVVQGVYEMGSTMKPLYAALALERGIIGMDTLVDATGPMRWGRHTFRDYFRMPDEMTVAEMMARSANVATVRLAQALGTEAVRPFMESLGMLAPPPLDLPEAALGRPLLPPRWADISTLTMSYGYGIAVTPLHMAVAYAALVNGGYRVTPTLDPEATPPGEDARVLSARTSARMREILRGPVNDRRGTARRAAVAGYDVGGKTGTAEKTGPDGAYVDDRVRASFVAAFPMRDPAYVLAITLDEPEDNSGEKPARGAGITAAPVAGAAIARLAPLLGLRPVLPEDDGAGTVTVAGR